MLYARDIIPGGYRDRLFVRLDEPQVPDDLWWLSVDGIYRPREDPDGACLRLLPTITDSAIVPEGAEAGPVHPKYKLPVTCFAYVGSAAEPKTWRLPYLLADGSPDLARLPKAIQAILSNYRGARLSTVPEPAIPEVLVTLGRTAQRLGKLPATGSSTAPVYLQLQDALEQLGRLTDVIPEP
jgi:hypothetical protein